ncbi:hypothetical protein DAERI_090086 [Deinococcus aerius]|uniref:Uncharacterized protein n=1 Tax=Deinococcus aerius TaxID=200253 RepID=A0A2I9D7N1_9DEIO|nr:hypothetical protein [Deinococcus aerius]GBF06500.1 hypothetical protein DAERI_090086 [Deinococcus aerius]
MPRLKTISLRTLLTDREKLPLRPDDRFEHLLDRFRVPFYAGRVGKGLFTLQRENLVLYLRDGVLNSLELTASGFYQPSDLVNWCGFDIIKDNILGWCETQGIELRLVQETEESRLWEAPSGALIAIQGDRLWNIAMSVQP